MDGLIASHAAQPVGLLGGVNGRSGIGALSGKVDSADGAGAVGSGGRDSAAGTGVICRGLGGGSRGSSRGGDGAEFGGFALFFELRGFGAGETPLVEGVCCELLGVVELGGLGHVRRDCGKVVLGRRWWEVVDERGEAGYWGAFIVGHASFQAQS